MDEILDILWFKIVEGIHFAAGVMDHVVGPLNHLGPAVAVFILALAAVGMTKGLKRVYTTRRYEALKKEFQHWYALRQEALTCEDPEKGKALARNIDQAKLNKVYYDYFFEGLLKSILTTYLPILLLAAYVNEAYRSELLLEKFGQAQIFIYSGSGGDPVVVGAVLWLVISLLLIHLAWFFTARAIGGRKKPLPSPGPSPAAGACPGRT